jgi:hypothetical protein
LGENVQSPIFKFGVGKNVALLTTLNPVKKAENQSISKVKKTDNE